MASLYDTIWCWIGKGLFDKKGKREPEEPRYSTQKVVVVVGSSDVTPPTPKKRKKRGSSNFFSAVSLAARTGAKGSERSLPLRLHTQQEKNGGSANAKEEGRAVTDLQLSHAKFSHHLFQIKILTDLRSF